MFDSIPEDDREVAVRLIEEMREIDASAAELLFISLVDGNLALSNQLDTFVGRPTELHSLLRTHWSGLGLTREAARMHGSSKGSIFTLVDAFVAGSAGEAEAIAILNACALHLIEPHFIWSRLNPAVLHAAHRAHGGSIKDMCGAIIKQANAQFRQHNVDEKARIDALAKALASGALAKIFSHATSEERIVTVMPDIRQLAIYIRAAQSVFQVSLTDAVRISLVCMTDNIIDRIRKSHPPGADLEAESLDSASGELPQYIERTPDEPISTRGGIRALVQRLEEKRFVLGLRLASPMQAGGPNTDADEASSQAAISVADLIPGGSVVHVPELSQQETTAIGLIFTALEGSSILPWGLLSLSYDDVDLLQTVRKMEAHFDNRRGPVVIRLRNAFETSPELGYRPENGSLSLRITNPDYFLRAISRLPDGLFQQQQQLLGGLRVMPACRHFDGSALKEIATLNAARHVSVWQKLIPPGALVEFAMTYRMDVDTGDAAPEHAPSQPASQELGRTNSTLH